MSTLGRRSWLRRKVLNKAFRRNVKRQTQKRRYRVIKYLGVGSFMVLGLWAGIRWGLPRLSFFQLKNIVVLGEPQTMSVDEVKQQVQITQGMSIFSVDLEEVQARLARHDYFSQVRIRRRLPHTLVVSVQEFRPSFLLYTGRFYYVAETGQVFRDITQTKESRDYPVVTGFTENDLLVHPIRIQRQLQQAAQLKHFYEKTDFAARFGLSEIHYEKNLGFTLYPEQKKYSIKFGTQEFGEKTKKLKEVLMELEESNFKFSSIDLNFPGKVLVSL